jgi:hypothetical protein
VTLRQNTPIPVDRLTALANVNDVFKNPTQLAFMREMIDAIRRGFSVMITKETAADELLLRSTGGKVFRVTVSDAGALVATHVQG